MACQLEYVDIGRVEWLWGQLLHEAMAALEGQRYQAAELYEQLADETLDALVWAYEGGGGYWWCSACECRHIIDSQ